MQRKFTSIAVVLVLTQLTISQSYESKYYVSTTRNLDSIFNPNYVEADKCKCIDPLAENIADGMLDPEPCPEDLTWPSSYFNATSSPMCLNMTYKETNHIIKIPADGYGAKCGRWDLLVEPECNRNINGYDIPERCYSYWCFVDKNDCERPNHATKINGMQLGVPDLYSSYETCGNINAYSSKYVYSELNSKTIRIAFPGDSGDGYLLKTMVDRDGQTVKTGATAEFMYNIFVRNNIKYEVKNVTEKSKNRYTSSYTACVHDVALGEVDMCIGPFWRTSERIILTSFTNSLLNDEFRLISALAKDDNSLLTAFKLPFKPFNTNAWIAIFFLCFYFAFVLQLIQNGDWPRTVDDWTKLLGDVSFWAVANLTKGEVLNQKDEGVRAAEKIASIGFVLFGLIIITAYTATSAAALIATSTEAQYATLEDVIKSGGNLCIDTPILTTFKSIYYPEAKNDKADEHNLLGVSSPEEGLELIDDALKNGISKDNCVATIMKDGSYENIQSKSSDHCNKIRVGPVLYAAGNGFPINDEFGRLITYIIDEQINLGKFRQYENDARSNFVGSSFCADSKDEGGGGGDEFFQLNANQLVAPVVTTITMSTLALLISFFQKIKRKKSSSSDAANSEENTTRVYHDQNHDLELTVEQIDTITRTTTSNQYPFYATLNKADEELYERLLYKTASELKKGVKDLNVNEDDFAMAMNALPATELLIELYYERKCSEEGRNMFYFCKKLAIADLLRIITQSKYYKSREVQRQVDEIISSSTSKQEMKERLIKNQLMIHKDLRRTALLEMKNKQSQQQPGNGGDYPERNVNTLLQRSSNHYHESSLDGGGSLLSSFVEQEMRRRGAATSRSKGGSHSNGRNKRPSEQMSVRSLQYMHEPR